MKILGRNEIQKLVEEEPNKYIGVVIGEPEEKSKKQISLILKNLKEYINPIFYDIWRPWAGEGLEPGDIPSKEAIKEILDWAKDKDTENMLIACKAGISRSSSIAYLILCMHSSPGKAVKILDYDEHAPNRLILKLGAEILNDPKILEAIDDHYNGYL